MLKNINIRRKLEISFITLIVFMIIQSFLSGFYLYTIREENQRLYNHPFTVSNEIKDIEIDVRIMYTLMNKLIDENNSENVDQLILELREVEDDFEVRIEVIEENYLGDPEDVDNLHDNFRTSEVRRQTVIDLVKVGDYDGARNAASQGIPLRDEIYDDIDKITNFAEGKAIELRESVDNKTRAYLITSISISGTLILLTIVGFAIVVRDIYPPIYMMLETIESHQKGKPTNLLPIDRGDEIGTVSRAMNNMIDHMKSQQEITELNLKLENVKQQNLYKFTVMSIGDGVIQTDLYGNISEINPVAEELTGFTRNESIGLQLDKVFKLVSTKTKRPIKNLVKKAIKNEKQLESNREITLISKDKTRYHIDASYSPIKDDDNNIFGVVVVFRNITDEIKRQKEIEYLSEHDTLTKLKNRYYLEKKFIGFQENEVVNVGIIMGDVNGLKITNDAFGHAFGDKLLIDISNILIESTKDYESTIVRWGGDEFIVIVEDINLTQLEELCQTIHNNCTNYKTSSPVKPNISLGHSLRTKTNQNLYRTLISAEDMMYENKLLESTSNRSKIVSGLESSLYEKSNETEEHALRVAEYSKMIAEAIDLTRNEVNQTILLAKLHDIGKISIDDTILNKSGKLDSKEWDLIRKHPETGYRIASSLKELANIAEGILYHHEHYDGNGYPRGIKGDNIPLMSRIICIADAFDVMTSKRVYKRTLTKEQAIEELIRCKGTQFDPHLVDIFIENLNK